MSERRACKLVGLSRSVWRYRSRRSEPEGFRTRMLELAARWPRFGYPRIHVMLRREGFAVNRKRTYRIYCEEKLQVRRRKRKKRAGSAPREALLLPEQPHQRWSMDFVSDRVQDGRAFRVLAVVDDFTRTSVALEAAISFPGENVGHALDRAAAKYGWPSVIVCDNGPEFRSNALDRWAYERGVTLHFIDPGKPVKNAFAECLSQTWFTSLGHAQREIASWRDLYNNTRPHGSLGWKTPVEAERAALSSPERLFGEPEISLEQESEPEPTNP